jgi:pSer/pThr/pTyr-binding forkhead associated (FHA) protein
MPYPVPTSNQSAAELKRQIELEREGEPFVIYREPGGEQHLVSLAGRERLVIGRDTDTDVTIEGDDAVSRLHAELVRVGGSWVVADDGLSTNGTFVDGERLLSRRRLSDRDLIAVGGTGLLYRDPKQASIAGRKTRAAGPEEAVMPAIGEVQRRVLVALCRPLADGSAIASVPASNQAIAAELHMSVGAVKANLRVLFEKFGVDDLVQNQKRAALAERALRIGAVRPSELTPQDR